MNSFELHEIKARNAKTGRYNFFLTDLFICLQRTCRAKSVNDIALSCTEWMIYANVPDLLW